MSPRSLQGASGGILGLLWDPPGRQLDPLGAPLGPPWELRGRSWALLARSRASLARSCSHFLLKFSPEELRRAILADLRLIFSRFCYMFASLSPAWVSVWLRKTAQTSREPARTWRKLASSAVPPTSNSHKGAAVARSEFNTLLYYILLYTIIYYYILLYTTIHYYILLYTTIYYYILLYTTI